MPLDPLSYEFRATLDRWLTTEPQGKPTGGAEVESCFYCDGHGGEFVGNGYGKDVWEVCSRCRGTNQIED